ncbi:MAG: hypothetical protein JOZ53_16670, partial [Planctomycetaceae bacterium]|nr:hypothetical protein [Planctomycetaceae bacterium]
MAISRQVRRKLVPGVDRLEPRQLLSMMAGQPGAAPMLAPALVAPAASAPRTSTAATSSTVNSLHFVTSPNVPFAGLNATSAVPSNPNDVWAVGSFLNTSTNLIAPLAEHFNGTSWSVVPTASLPSGTAGSFNSVAAVSSNNVWAVGNSTGPLIEHWDGTKWSIVPTPSAAAAGTLNAVTAIAANDVWAVGAAGGSNLVEHFDGTSWSVVPSPFVRNSHLSGVSGTSSSDVWAVGSAGRSTSDHVEILHWNGTAWSVVSAPSPGLEPFLTSVVALAPNNAWAVGQATLPVNSSVSTGQTLIEHWDGTSWSVVPSPNAGGGSPSASNELLSVAAVSADNIWAVGEFLDPSLSQFQTLTEHFDGTSWSVIPSPNATTGHNFLSGVTALSTGDVVAVGGANSANNQTSTDLILANNEPL